MYSNEYVIGKLINADVNGVLNILQTTVLASKSSQKSVLIKLRIDFKSISIRLFTN